MTVQERLKFVRDMQRKTQKEMAVLLGISPRTWQDYEGGVNVPGWKVLEGLARLGFNINWILTEEGEVKQKIPELEQEEHVLLRTRLQRQYLKDVRGVFYALDDHKLTEEKLFGYMGGEYIPTKDELESLCTLAGKWDFTAGKPCPEIEQIEIEERKSNKLKFVESNKSAFMQLLKNVSIEIEIELLQAGITLLPEKKAELLTLAYDIAAENPDKESSIKDKILRLVNLVK